MGADRAEIAKQIREGKTVLGIEFGSTRIKAVLIGEDRQPVADGAWDWENRLEDGVWTYHLQDVRDGLQGCFRALAADVETRYGEKLTRIMALGISAMMHGYLVFDENDALLVPFRTWRNTMTEEASRKLTEVFGYPIPQRFSIAHLYQAILKKEPHVPRIRHMTTLAGYVHFLLTGERILGVGEASGMFPIDAETCDYDEKMLTQFADLIADCGYPWSLREILPRVACAGESAGTLTPEGALLLDPSGTLQPGAPLCPPEGDAGTGMTATHSTAPKTGNVSAGTSVFAMVVLEHPLQGVYDAVDLVTTPEGKPTAMVHCNNCTSDLNAWVGLFREFAQALGHDISDGELFSLLYGKAMEGDADGGGLLAYNYYSGEHVTGFAEGRPLFARRPDAPLTLANFMRTHLMTALGALKTGLDILLGAEKVRIDEMYGHGGLFKTKGAGQRLMAAAVAAPVTVMETAGEGGAWGMALLASYMCTREPGEDLSAFLENRVFRDAVCTREEPRAEDVEGFARFLERYKKGLPIEQAAVERL